MAGVAVDVGTGSSIAFATTVWSAELLSLAWSDITRDTVETTHMGTDATPGTTEYGSQTFIPVDIADGGVLTAEVHFNPDAGSAALKFPIGAVAETITVTFPNSATWAFSGFCTGVDVSDPMEDVMTATLTIRVTAGVTVTP
jgi:hypothetical protein